MFKSHSSLFFSLRTLPPVQSSNTSIENWRNENKVPAYLVLSVCVCVSVAHSVHVCEKGM